MIFGDNHSSELAAMLVPLDAIFDTRLGTIAKFGLEDYKRVQVSGYYGRISDHFNGIDSEKYFQLYRERDAVTLSMSGITHIVSLIKDFAKRVHNVSATGPVKKVPRIDINVFPYDPPTHVTDMMEKALKVVVSEHFDISFVRYSPSDMHYDLINHTYDQMVLYEIGPWISAQIKEWEKRNKAHNSLTVFIPILCHEKDKSKVPEDIFPLADEADRLLKPLMNLIQLPVNMFCQVATPFSQLEAEEATSGAEAPEVDKK